MYEATLALCRQAGSLADANKGGVLWSYYACLHEDLLELLDGNPDPVDCVPFTCFKCTEGSKDFDQDVVAAFREEWAREIGEAAGVITSLSTDLKRALRKED